ncbi:hypothetical protein [Elizabethkingia meningoseptica]
MAEIYSNAGDAEKSLVSADEGIELAKNNKDYILQLSIFLLMKGVKLSKLNRIKKQLFANMDKVCRFVVKKSFLDTFY